MSDDAPKFDKGDRAVIRSGKDAGTAGTIFWSGENKYGPGYRYGMRTDDGATLWVDEGQLGGGDAAPPPPAPSSTTFDKGDRVKITKGPSSGTEGEIFWVGDSKFGPGKRYGLKDDDGESHWADGHQVEASSSKAPPRQARDRDASPSRAPREHRPAPRGGADDLPPEAYEEEEGLDQMEPPASEPPPFEAPLDEDLPPEAFE